MAIPPSGGKSGAPSPWRYCSSSAPDMRKLLWTSARSSFCTGVGLYLPMGLVFPSSPAAQAQRERTLAPGGNQGRPSHAQNRTASGRGQIDDAHAGLMTKVRHQKGRGRSATAENAMRLGHGRTAVIVTFRVILR